MNQKSEYRLGQRWSDDFDYEGMLRLGLETSAQTPLDQMLKLFESMEDVNYHREAEPLWNAIHAKKRAILAKDGLQTEAEIADLAALDKFLADFHQEIRNTLESFAAEEV